MTATFTEITTATAIHLQLVNVTVEDVILLVFDLDEAVVMAYHSSHKLMVEVSDLWGCDD
jgi:hypothetical protein